MYFEWGERFKQEISKANSKVKEKIRKTKTSLKLATVQEKEKKTD